MKHLPFKQDPTALERFLAKLHMPLIFLELYVSRARPYKHIQKFDDALEKVSIKALSFFLRIFGIYGYPLLCNLLKASAQ
jgi:hypothetical protein